MTSAPPSNIGSACAAMPLAVSGNLGNEPFGLMQGRSPLFSPRSRRRTGGVCRLGKRTSTRRFTQSVLLAFARSLDPSRSRAWWQGRCRSRLEFRQPFAIQPEAIAFLDESEVRFGGGAHKADGHATHARTARATNTVYVIVGGAGQVEVHHRGQLGHVDATRGDVGRNQHLQIPRFEVSERLSACALAKVPMQRSSGKSHALKF